MDDTLSFALVFIIGIACLAAMVFASFGGDIDVLVPGGADGSLLASASAAVQSDDVSKTVGQFLISFDYFKNVHTTVLDPRQEIRVLDVEIHSDSNRMYAATDRGLFLSRDGGLTWNRFVTSANEITDAASMFSLISLSSNGDEYLVSVFSGGVGTVYRTRDSFFSLEKIIDFDGEVPYDMRLAGSELYLAMSSGQLIAWDLSKNHTRVVNAFRSPIVRIYAPSDGKVYLLLKSGTLLKGNSLASDFKQVRVSVLGFLPFWKGAKVLRLAWDKSGTLYAHAAAGVWKSTNSGISFALLKNIPMQKKQIDALAVDGTIIHVVSGTRMFSSYDGARHWKVTDLPNKFKVSNIYFTGDRIVLSM